VVGSLWECRVESGLLIEAVHKWTGKRRRLREKECERVRSPYNPGLVRSPTRGEKEEKRREE